MRLLLLLLACGPAWADLSMPTDKCKDAYSPIYEYPTAEAVEAYTAANQNTLTAFELAMKLGKGEAVEYSAGLADLETACAAASGTTCSSVTDLTVGGEAFSAKQYMCVPDLCVNAWDLQDATLVVSHHQTTYCLIYGLIADVESCKVSVDCGFENISTWGTIGIGGGMFIFTVAAMLAVYLPTSAEFVGSLNGYSYAKGDASTELLPQPTGSGQGGPPAALSASGGGEGTGGVWAKIKKAWDPFANFDSLFKRTSGAYAPLDGLRAWAVMWVVGLHSMITWPQYTQQLEEYKEEATNPTPNVTAVYKGLDVASKLADEPIMQPLAHGAMGVDIFFVLSGFLIAHMLLREKDRTGTFNVFRFLGRRFLRLYPAYAVAVALNWWLVPGDNSNTQCSQYLWTMALFINNFWGLIYCESQSWSIAIEFQFYLVSPIIVYLMSLEWEHRRFLRHRNRAVFVPFVLGLLTIALRALLIINDAGDSDNYMANPNTVYVLMYTRGAPYLSGMTVAFLYRDYKQALDKGRDHWLIDFAGPQKWACDVFHLFLWGTMTYWGVPESIAEMRGDPDSWIVLSVLLVGRAAFGQAIAYGILMCLSGHWRPLSWVLSWRVWLPIARLSYGAYLMQFLALGYVPWFIWVEGTNNEVTAFFVYVMFLYVVASWTFLMAFGIYMVAEKPMMGLIK